MSEGSECAFHVSQCFSLQKDRISNNVINGKKKRNWLWFFQTKTGKGNQQEEWSGGTNLPLL